MTEMAHVAQWKETQVDDLVRIMAEKPVVGIVNIYGIPGPQIQKMRKGLKNKAILRISKLNLIKLALEKMEDKKKGIKPLQDALIGQIGLIVTDMNPFSLFRVLEASKTSAPAKGGETASEDIEISEGETSFKPGPIVGELQRVGIPSAIEGGKVLIKSDKTLVKAGDIISFEVAQMLTKLEIYPLTVGFDLQAVFEDGSIFKKSDLDVDVQKFLDQLAMGSRYGFNLAINTNYVNPVTIMPLLQTAHHRAMNLLFNAKIISPATINFMLQSGVMNMFNLSSRLDEAALGDKLKERFGFTAKVKTAVTEEKPSKDAEKEKKEEVSEEETA